MNRRWIAVAIIVVALIGAANVFILFVLMPRWSKAAGNSPAGSGSTAAATLVAGSSSVPANGVVPAARPGAPSRRPRPSAPPVQAGLRVERQVLSPSGNLRVRYLRDRQQGIRQIALQDVHNPANEMVLAQYKRNAWVVVSPNDEWVMLDSRDGGESSVELYHRVSASPLKYEVPEELRSGAGALRDVVWQSYLSDTQQDPNIDRRKVTIDATAWEPDSQRVTLSVAPIPTKNDADLPLAWTCFYNVATKQVEPMADADDGEVAEGPAGDDGGGAPNEATAAPVDNAIADDSQAEPPTEESSELEGERFPATREQEITVSDVNELELSDIRYAIFEIFARHGANISDPKMRAAFSGFSWYQPRTDVTFDDVETEFSDIEKHNLAILRRVRDAKVASARRSEPKPVRGEQVPEESQGQRFLRGVLQSVSDALNGGNQ